MITASEIAKMEFKPYILKSPWDKIIGEPVQNSSILMFSGPGSGKSTVALQMGDAFTLHGKVGYNAQEEGFSATLQNKLDRLGLLNSAINFFECENIDELKQHVQKDKLDFLIVDSFTMYDKRLSKFEEFRTWCKKQNCVLVAIVQTTKEGKFYGNADAAFNVDCVLKVTDGKPSTIETGKNRLGELYEHEVDLRNKPVKPVERTNPNIPITQLEGTATKNDLPHNRADNFWNDDSVKVDFKIKPWHTDPEKAKEHFKLKGIEFGNWLNAEDRVNYLANTMQALHNMATILGVPDSAIGIDYKLGIAFGARGQGGGAIAHYEPTSNTMINLTKEKGQNSLAHEYGHCIDNLVGKKLGKDYISGGRSVNKSYKIKGSKGIVKTINTFFEILFFDDGEKSKFYQRMIDSSEYYQRRTEILARCSDLYFVEKAKELKLPTDYIGDDTFGRVNPTKSEFKKAEPILATFYKEAFELLLDIKTKPVKKSALNLTGKEVAKLLRVDVKKSAIKPLAKNVRIELENGYQIYIIQNKYDFEINLANTTNAYEDIFTPVTIKSYFVTKEGLNEALKKALDKYKEINSSSSKKQLQFRLNGTDKALIYLGVCEQLDVDSDYMKGVKGSFMLSSNQAQNKLYIIHSSKVKNMKGSINDPTAEMLYQQWHNFSADGKDLEIDWPKGTTKEIGTATKILYVSDKIMRSDDAKGKDNYYKHDFDPGKRPVSVLGDMLIVENIKWNKRGILN